MNLIQKKLCHKLLRTIFFAFFGIFLSCCVSIKPIYFEDDKKIVQKQVENFHQLFNDEKYLEMYDLFSSETRKVVDFQEFSQSFQQLKKNVGKVKKSNLVSSDIKAQASYREIELIYETEFEKFTMREKFRYFVDGKNAVIDIYHKPELIPNS